MIDAAMAHLAAQLNAHLRGRLAVAEDLVAVHSVDELPGAGTSAWPAPVALFLAGVQVEGPAGAPSHGEAASPGLGLARLRRWTLRVVCAVSAGGPAYPEALKLLSLVIQYLQDHPVASRANSPALAPPLDQLTVLVEDLTPADLHHLWALHHGGRYLPSVVCRVALVGRFDEDPPPVVRP